MSLFTALFAGVNGVNSNGNVISVVGDNIANVNTTGYKASRASFEDIIAGGGSGLGSRVATVNPQFGQGGFESTTSSTDMAIDGRGFFVLKSATGATYYTRTGNFILDRDGYMVNNDGYQVQGYQVDSSHNLTSNIDSIQISSTPVPPTATSEIVAQLNIDANSTVPAAFSVASPTSTSNFSSGITTYDSLGNSHLVTIYYRKTAANSWSWYGLVDGGEITGGTAGTPEIEAQGILTFNTNGSLLSAVTSTSDFDFIGATQSQAITFDFGTSTASGGTGLDGVTQFGSDSSITNITQNGFASGSLTNISIGIDGTISGNYTNGTTQTLAQVVLGHFANENAIARAGGNNFTETLDSGPAIVGGPGTSGNGDIVPSTLEQSNVDLASELIRMVVIQRGFQASSRTISAVNDLMAQLVNLGQ